MALAVVMLLTFFMSEYFFATGLELRGMTTFKDAQQARSLARSVFKAVQLGLLQDEAEFFVGFGELVKLLEGGVAVPWNNGLLLTLQVAPQDHLFNVNQNHNTQAGQPQDLARRQVFFESMDRINVPALQGVSATEPVPSDVSLGLYAALWDWIDVDDDEYLEFASVRGAEADSYVGGKVEFDVKNGMLDRLDETRLLRGFQASRIPWVIWEHTFTALPRKVEEFYLTERINVNTASAAEIATFLETRRIDPNAVGGSHAAIHEALNEFADNAELIANHFAPMDEPRTFYSKQELQVELEELGFSDISKYGVGYAFSTINEFYRIRIVLEVAEVRARLDAMINVPRDADTRVAKGAPKVLWITLN